MITTMKNRGIRILFLGLCALFLIFLTGSKSRIPLLHSNIESIRVVMDNNYPPYSFLDENGNPEGILIDQWKLWESKTGIKVYISTMEWAKAMQEMEAGKYDVIDTIFFNEERAKIYDFTAPYADIEVPIYFDNNISGLTDVKSLKGFKVGVKSEDNAADILLKNGIDQLEYYDSYESMILAAKDKRLRVFVLDKPPAEYFIYKYGLQNQINSSASLYTGQFHRAVKKGDIALLQIVEDGFNRIAPSEYSAIETKWFGNHLLSVFYIRYVMVGVGLACLIFLLLVLSNRELQRRVNLRTSELNSLFSAMPEIVMVLDQEGRCLSIPSTASPVISGYKENILGKALSDWLPNPTSFDVRQNIQSVLSKQTSETLESSIVLNDQTYWFSWIVSPLDKNRVLFVGHDFTQWKNTQEALLESEQRFRIMFENHDVCMMLISPDDGQIIDVNQAAVNFYGYTAEQMREMSISQINRLPDVEIYDAINKIVEEKQTKFIFPHRLAAGDTRTVEIHSSPVKVNNKKMLFSIIFDITDRKLAEEGVIAKTLELAEAYDATLEGWSNALELRERETAGHSKRVVEMTLKICRELGVPEDEMIHIQRGALLHDIGKMGVPDNILLKPGSLSPDEWVIMRQHPLYAFRMLSKIPFLERALEIPYSHHERWDGSGYPRGLKGEEIPLSARVFAVVDVWDALISDRPYRPAWSEESALQYVKDNAFVLFDPEIVKIFFQIHQQISKNNIG
jgi:PAS domain S-box-containing protein/putative nucleotidyltransferase with HDIG domain